MRTVGVLLAGGTGLRMASETPKQLLRVAGRPILEHTIRAFADAANIDEIIVLMAPGYVDDAKAIADHYPKVRAVLEGGSTRNETTRLALGALGQDECKVLIHDAVRPLVTNEIIQRCIDALDIHGAVDVVIPTADTIVQVEDDIITDIPDRSALRRGQTPQGFMLSVLRSAYEESSRDGDAHTTDDCGLVRRYRPDVPIFIVEGAESNLKITRPLDAYIADKLFQVATREARQLPADALREEFAGRVMVVIGAGAGIGADIATLAQSYGAHVHSFSRSVNDTDIRSVSDLEAALQGVHDQHGRIDYVVNSAAVLQLGKLAETSIDDLRHSIDVNYLGCALLAKVAFPYLQKSGGRLLFFTSSSYTRGRAGYSLYSSAKAAVVNLTQALAEEWADDNIRVNCINPERTATPMRVNAFGAEDPVGLLSSAEVAERCIGVLVDDVTGQVFDIRKESYK